VGIEKLDNCVLETDERGIPRRPTSMDDVRRADLVPPQLVHVDCPAGFSRAAPATHPPYATGRHSLPSTEGETDE
jgi:hypothetical protein